jgi:hypothetical protein
MEETIDVLNITSEREFALYHAGLREGWRLAQDAAPRETLPPLNWRPTSLPKAGERVSGSGYRKDRVSGCGARVAAGGSIKASTDTRYPLPDTRPFRPLYGVIALLSLLGAAIVGALGRAWGTW